VSRKKSAQVHAAEGTFRATRHGKRPVAGPVKLGGKPAKPKLNRDASRAWDELFAMVGPRVVSEDAPQLEQLATFLARWRGLNVALDREDPGTTRYSRLLTACSIASRDFDRIAKRFGLTPADRESMSLPVADDGVVRWES
jgi:hypothetical protein